MPTKPQFDPNIHLSDAKKKEFEDEELARRLQRELMEEETAERERVRQIQEDSSQRSQEMDDMELARRLQFGDDDDEDDPMQRHLDERQRETGISDQLEYARRLQQQALRDVDQAPASHGTQEGPGANKDDADLALARRMNELYEMGMDSCANFESFEALRNDRPSNQSRPGGPSNQTSSAVRSSGPSNHAPSAARSSDSSHGSGPRRSQEVDDAAIARMMAESGESLRDLDLTNLPPQGARNPPRISTPGAHHIPIPAGYSDTMRRAAAGSNQMTPTLQADKKDQPARRRSNEPRSAARAPEPRSAPRASEPRSSGRRSHGKPKKNRKSSARQSDQLQSLPEREYDPPGVPLPASIVAMDEQNSGAMNSKPKAKGRAGLFGFGLLPTTRNADPDPATLPTAAVVRIPVSARPPPARKPGPVPYSFSASRQVNVPIAASPVPKKKKPSSSSRPPVLCSACNEPASHYLSALDKRYHHNCFRCMGCHNSIDTSGPFAYMEDESGEKHPLHKECFSELYGVKCAVCRKSIPAGPDGKVSFVKHPFFDSEQMCPSHAASPGRRCTGCHRFEPEDEPFADLGDVGRVVCYSCCRTAVVDSSDAEPLWRSVIRFFEKELNLPIWADMKEVPVLVVGYKSLNEQMKQTGGVHGGSSQIMTRGVCLTEHQTQGRKFKASSLKFNKRKQSFERRDEHQKGFTFLQVPDANKVNPDSSVTCILCLSGLPKDLTASVLAHEATHAWIKLHPRYDVLNPLDPQVEEGCAQLVAMLFLSEGLPQASTDTDQDGGPTEEKLRQYFKFSIESDSNEIYGEGYRKAAAAYSKIGIEALLSHVVLYKDFPNV